MGNIIIFNSITGKILRNVSGPENALTIQHNPDVDENFIYGTTNGDSYILNGEITQRPTQSTTIDKTTLTANGVDVITISGAPTNATFTARNQTTGETVSGLISGSDTFSTAIAGSISFKIECWPYLDWTAIVEAV